MSHVSQVRAHTLIVLSVLYYLLFKIATDELLALDCLAPPEVQLERVFERFLQQRLQR